MNERTTYPPGVPCWVETLQREPRAAQDFYSSLFGWEIACDDGGDYAVARLRGRDVAGIGALPDDSDGLAVSWLTHVRVDSADDAARAAAAAGGTIVREAFDVEPAGRLAVLADPGGATFCAWEAGIREGAELINEHGAWAMSALQSSDQPAALAFYGALFGWEPEAFGPMTLFRLPGYVGGTEEQPVPRDVVAVLMPADRAPSRWGVDFWVADADATAAQAEALGGTAVVAPHDTPGFRNAILADPEGATFSVDQLVPAPA